MKKNRNRIKPLLSKVEEAWQKHPDLRLGQLLIGLLRSEEVTPCPGLFYLEDEELLRRLEVRLNEIVD